MIRHKTRYIGRGSKPGAKLGRLTFAVAVVAACMLPAKQAAAIEHDLSAPGSQTLEVVGQFGGSATIADHWEQPTGTGVFDPFLSLDSNGQTSTGNKYIEQAYNTDGFTALYLDQHRPQWNNLLKVGDLATVTDPRTGVDSFAFILDANEPGGSKSLISIDNIRIYTSAGDNTASVANDISKLDDLGNLRWAMNDPLVTGTEPPDLNGFNVEQWVKLDAAQENVSHGNANGGSGQGDMIVYVPQTAFAGASANDFVWFYNLNGVHYSVDELKGTAAESGFEEWRAVVGPQQVPETGSTLLLLGSALAVLGLMSRRHKLAGN